MKDAMFLPTLPIQVALEASLHQSMHATHRLMEQLHYMLAQRLDDLLCQLGVPGCVELEVTLADVRRPHPLPITLHVNHRSCDYSWDLTRRLYCYVSGAVFDEIIHPEEMTDKLRMWCSQADDEDAHARVIELFSLICVEAIKLQPSVMLGHEQLTAYRDQLVVSSAQFDPAERKVTPEGLAMLEWVAQVLSFALDHKLSITGSARLLTSESVTALLLHCRQQGMTYIDASEELMDALVSRSTEVEVHFAPGYLREVTDSDDADLVKEFNGPREIIYDEFGLSLPGFKFVENPTFKPRSFALKINTHLLTPWVGPPSRLGFSTTQIQIDYVVRALDSDLRANLHCLFPRWAAEDYVSGLEQTFPTLLRMVKDRFNQTQRARVLRVLLANQFSLRNLRLILERMLDYDGDPDDLNQFDIFVRAGLARHSI